MAGTTDKEVAGGGAAGTQQTVSHAPRTSRSMIRTASQHSTETSSTTTSSRRRPALEPPTANVQAIRMASSRLVTAYTKKDEDEDDDEDEDEEEQQEKEQKSIKKAVSSTGTGTNTTEDSWSSGSEVGPMTEIHMLKDKDGGNGLRRVRRVDEEGGDNEDDDDRSEDRVSVGMSVDSYNETGADHASQYSTPEEDQDEIARRESEAVFFLRAVVVMVLSCACVACCLGVYFYLSNFEKEGLKATFRVEAHQVLVGVQRAMEQTLTAADAFGLHYVSHAQDTNSVWPFVTLSSGFAIQAARVMELSHSFAIGVNMVVSQDERAAWEEYTSQNNMGWMEQSLQVQGVADGAGYETVDSIWGRTTDSSDIVLPSSSSSLYLPLWQNAPLVPSNAAFPYVYNEDALSTEDNSIQTDLQVLLDQPTRVVIGSFENVVFDEANDLQVTQVAKTQSWVKALLDSSSSSSFSDEERIGLESEPFITISYPILDSLMAYNNNNGDQAQAQAPAEDAKMVGRLKLSVFWKSWMEHLLPSQSVGLIVVLEDLCLQNSSFTYELNGGQATFVGVGDLHDLKYNHLAISSSLYDMIMTDANDMVLDQDLQHQRSYSGLLLADQGNCSHVMTVYPSQYMQDEYTTANRVLFTILIASVFLFVAFIFVLYDCLVLKRQNAVMERANLLGGIVTSLYPAQVREQLFEEKEGKNGKDQDMMGDLTAFMNRRGGKDVADDKGGNSSRPIADNFEETTIMFADLSSFTKWSANHTPGEVFQLLETLYGAFDRIATRLKVFKVETIGDCYLAVTGLPNAQPDHASIMARFAAECLRKMQHLVEEMAETLGPDTMDMQLRVGLHSGPTTAGVLRGQKARFQLFGDTVNTAARMETNGFPGRIHISQATADSLIVDGKGHWIVAREDLIEAKGKGKMQTYWVQIKSSASRVE